MGAAPAIEIDRATKRFGGVAALDDVSLSVPAGAFFALLGPSGCGKTTLMRLIAGFETPDAGAVRLDGRNAAGTPPEARPVNMMFQSYALFPHMNVAQNVGYGLRRAGAARAAVAEGVTKMLRLVQLEGLGARKPHELSGGQRQRVALARALARRPRILLLDEPMAALDRKLREETQFAIKDIQRELGTTILVVTHDQDEAMGMADTIALMRAGRIEQTGTPADLYDRPATRFAARFIGETNLFEGRVVSVEGGTALVETLDGDMRVPARHVGAGASVAIAVRPERIAIGAGAENALDGVVHDLGYRGPTTVLRVRLPSGTLARVATPRRDHAAPGEPVALSFAAADAWLLDA